MRTNMLLCAVGVAGLAVGGFFSPWSLLVALGATSLSVGLLRDDGKPKT